MELCCIPGAALGALLGVTGTALAAALGVPGAALCQMVPLAALLGVPGVVAVPRDTLPARLRVPGAGDISKPISFSTNWLKQSASHISSCAWRMPSS